jgi:hypothetical protein
MSDADHEAHLREQISADAAAGDSERAVLDGTSPAGTTAAGPATAGADPLEPALPGAQVTVVSRSRTPELLATGGLVAVVLYVLWRLRLRRQPPTPSERLTGSAKAVGAASLAAGSRAVDKLSDNAGPTAGRAADLAKRGVQTGAGTAQRAASAAAPVVATAAATAAQQGLKVGAKVGAKAVDNAGDLASKAGDVAGDLASKAGDVAGDVATIAAQAGQAVTSTVADVAESLGDAGHTVHKTYRKWTFRLWFGTFAAIGYVLGARAGRERYEQILSLAGRVAQQPPVQQAKNKVTGSV